MERTVATWYPYWIIVKDQPGPNSLVDIVQDGNTITLNGRTDLIRLAIALMERADEGFSR